MSAEETFERFASRILFLTCVESADESALASGVLVSADGFIVTNAHVVGRCRSMTATYIDGASRRSYEPVLKYYDEQSDTAVLKIATRNLEFFDVLARPARIGERVYAIGNPRGLEQSISEGIVSGKREEDGVPWIQHSAPISPGSSGGALISSRGELLGINAWTRTDSQNLNFAVPAATLVKALSGAQSLAGLLDFPPNALLTGTYSGVVLNRTMGVSADFNVIVTETNHAIQGCMEVKPPLFGSGSLRGTTHGSQFSFVIFSDFAHLSFQGQRGTNDFVGAYSVSIPSEGPAQNGTFVFHKTSAQTPRTGLNIQNCPNDAMVARQGADQGNPMAQLSLGLMYYRGLGVPQDYVQAIAWIRKAADQGSPSAQLSLGVAYENGQGVARDYCEAYFWVTLAAAQKPPGVKPEEVASVLGAIAGHLTPAGLFETQERARDWLVGHPTKAQ